MPTEPQRVQMLAAMGIDVYRLRGAANETAGAVQIFVDAQARVCVSGAGDETTFAWLAHALRVLPEQLCFDAGDVIDSVRLENGALPRDAAGKRALWRSLKPLARQMQHKRNLQE